MRPAPCPHRPFWLFIFLFLYFKSLSSSRLSSVWSSKRPSRTMGVPKRTVLITGCSAGGMGAALAKEFHSVGLLVIATARDTTKMTELTALGIETMELDVQSSTSIAACVAKIHSLDLLINNAGASYTMPIADIDIDEARKLFETNVWGCIAVTQAFLPLLMDSPKALIVNHTSIGAGMSIPFQGVYNASKAAMSMFSETMRLELEAFGISVVNLKTGGVQTNIVKNIQARTPRLPDNSIYLPAREAVESALRSEWVEKRGMGIPAEQWAKQVVAELLKEKPPTTIWKGESAWTASLLSWLPTRWFDGMMKSMTGLADVEKMLRLH